MRILKLMLFYRPAETFACFAVFLILLALVGNASLLR